MATDLTLEELWDSTPFATEVFEPEAITHLPTAAQRYLRHAIAPGTKLWSAVRLTMRGTIRLGAEWLPFEAEQVNRWDRGFIWRAKVTKSHLPIVGSDRWLDGEASMKWKLLGVVPVAKGEGPEIARSAAGRLNVEAIWLPTAWLGGDVTWSEHDATHADAMVRAHGESSRVEIEIDPEGAPRSLCSSRWGNPEGKEFHYEDFGGFVSGERTFSGVTIPTEVRIGWHFGSPRFDEPGGEFFRGTIESAEFR